MKDDDDSQIGKEEYGFDGRILISEVLSVYVIKILKYKYVYGSGFVSITLNLNGDDQWHKQKISQFLKKKGFLEFDLNA